MPTFISALLISAAMTASAGAARADGAKITVIGGSVTWLVPRICDNLGPDAAKLIQTALRRRPSPIVGPDWAAQAEDDAVEQVAAAGVPLIICKSGGQEAAGEAMAAIESYAVAHEGHAPPA